MIAASSRGERPDPVRAREIEPRNAQILVFLGVLSESRGDYGEAVRYFEEAKKFTESMIKGEPRLGHMIKQTFKEAIEGFLPHKK